MSKRRLLTVLLLLVGGAIANVAVAWGIAGIAGAVPIREGFFREMSAVESRTYWLEHAPAEWAGADIIEGNAVESWAFGRWEVLVIAEAPEAEAEAATTASMPPLMGVGSDDLGWPLKSMRCFTVVAVENRIERGSARWAWRVEAPWLGWRTLPLQPSWPGFAINSVFYAGMLWLLFAAPFALRRRRRIQRGLCPKCAYDLRGSTDTSACPECGAAHAVKP